MNNASDDMINSVSELQVEELVIEELEDRTAMISGGCATSCSCECTSTTCVVWF